MRHSHATHPVPNPVTAPHRCRPRPPMSKESLQAPVESGHLRPRAGVSGRSAFVPIHIKARDNSARRNEPNSADPRGIKVVQTNPGFGTVAQVPRPAVSVLLPTQGFSRPSPRNPKQRNKPNRPKLAWNHRFQSRLQSLAHPGNLENKTNPIPPKPLGITVLPENPRSSLPFNGREHETNPISPKSRGINALPNLDFCAGTSRAENKTNPIAAACEPVRGKAREKEMEKQHEPNFVKAP